MHYDVLIIGGGLAGLTLARQLTLTSGKKVLLVERREEIPPPKQKVGESTVQVGGYYFGKVLELESYLLHEHLMKYNLRFYWKTPGKPADDFQHYSQAFLRTLSNIPCYQLDRNTLEEKLVKDLGESPTVTLYKGVSALDVSLAENGPHPFTFQQGGATHQHTADWVVDASGRGAYLKNRLGLKQENDVRHGTSYFWISGTLDIETLSKRTPRDIRLSPDRQALGHLPLWLATNHFMGEGFWFWVIPLQNKTSFGLVYDTKLVPHDKVSTPQRLLPWLYQEFPLFKVLGSHKIEDSGSFRDFSFGAQQTLGKNRWALTGEAGRFSDPLYSPGSDLIALHNTLITHAITRLTPEEFEGHQFLYELLMKTLYDAFLPGYDTSYDCLGDPECFVMKYTWELSVYFSFFVLPFINDHFPQQAFILPYLEKFAVLGSLNRQLHTFLSGYYQWKKRAQLQHPGPLFHELSSLAPLKEAEKCFYQVGLTIPQTLAVLDDQISHLKELARFIIAHTHAMVVHDPSLLTHKDFVDSINLENFVFDPKAMAERHRSLPAARESYPWRLDPGSLKAFWNPTPSERLRPTG